MSKRSADDDLDLGYELPTYQGDAHFVAYPDGFYTEEDLEAWHHEVLERQRRRRPPGFAPWPQPSDSGA